MSQIGQKAAIKLPVIDVRFSLNSGPASSGLRRPRPGVADRLRVHRHHHDHHRHRHLQVLQSTASAP